MSRRQKREKKKVEQVRRARAAGAGFGKKGAAALAAAACVAAGTHAYAGEVRFDNPAHGEPGHFHWAVSGPSFEQVLDMRLPAESQPGLAYADSTVAHVLYGGNGYLTAITRDHIQPHTTSPYGPANLTGVSAGTVIPTGGYFYYRGYSSYLGSSSLPEGLATHLGMRFGGPYCWYYGTCNYGWIGVVRNGIELEAFAWGYETELNTPIPAGGTPTLAGDLDGDGCVDLQDLATLLGDFGCNAGCVADIDGDDDTDLQDLAIQLGNFGQCLP